MPSSATGMPPRTVCRHGRRTTRRPWPRPGSDHDNGEFYRKLDGQAWVGGPHPTRWLLTVADNGKLGYMKDTAIYSETDPVRNC